MNGRVWAYLSSRELNKETVHAISDETVYFLDSWNAHGTSLAGEHEIRDKRFLIIKVDEEKFGASGCSIDKQLKFIKDLEQKFSIELLNRLLVAYKSKSGNIEVVSPSKIKELFEAGEINADTIIFNPAVSNTSELENNFEIPLKESWLNAKYKLVAE